VSSGILLVPELRDTAVTSAVVSATARALTGSGTRLLIASGTCSVDALDDENDVEIAHVGAIAARIVVRPVPPTRGPRHRADHDAFADALSSPAIRTPARYDRTIGSAVPARQRTALS